MLVIASLVFYSMWKVQYIWVIVCSIVVNYAIGFLLKRDTHRRLLLATGIVINVAALCVFKYTYFAVTNLNTLFNTNIMVTNIALPLAISFFTFEQISYLAYCYYNKHTESFLNYSLFISFFPKLIAGPIVYPQEMLPQFASKENKTINYENIVKGLVLFFCGLFKKTVVADTLAIVAANGFDKPDVLSLVTAWATALAYTLQLYYDFSGYTDMACGVALMFNIHLPINFESPYKASNIQQFWKTWHMTLTRFLRDYIYIPMGGNRASRLTTYVNIFVVFLIGGIWHGAGWTFIIWGLLHGAAMVLHRAWQLSGLRMNGYIGWFLTFNFVNIAWVFFRAKSVDSAFNVLRGMSGVHELKKLLACGPTAGIATVAAMVINSVKEFAVALNGLFLEHYLYYFFFIFISLTMVLTINNTNHIVRYFKPSVVSSLLFSLVMLVSLLYLYSDISVIKPFLYFNF
ncbi:MAG: MBOAT family protein [Nitrospirae bacterium YQR-1]